MKLTAERARARIDQLTAPARELSMKEQDYLQALTLALEVLEAQEAGYATGGYVQESPAVVMGENVHERVLPAVRSDQQVMQHVEVICLDARQYESLSVSRAYGGKA